MAEQMFSAEEAAQLLGLQVRTVRNYVRDGRIPGVRIGKQYRIARADLDAFTSGAGTAEPLSREADPRQTPPEHTGPEVSSVVQIDGIDAASRERLERTITAVTVAGAQDASGLRVEPLYDDARRRLRLIIVGGVGETAELLRIVERFARNSD